MTRPGPVRRRNSSNQTTLLCSDRAEPLHSYDSPLLNDPQDSFDSNTD